MADNSGISTAVVVIVAIIALLAIAYIAFQTLNRTNGGGDGTLDVNVEAQ